MTKNTKKDLHNDLNTTPKAPEKQEELPYFFQFSFSLLVTKFQNQLL